MIGRRLAPISRIALVLLCLATACGFPRPADVESALCVPNRSSCVSTNEVEHCGPDGLPASTEACAAACVTEPTPHCGYLEPRYLPDVCDAIASTATFTVTNSATLDTTLDNSCTGGVSSQEDAAEICVVRYRSIHISTSGTLTVFGSRALALVADDSLLIEGTLDAGANDAANGPGGGFVLSGEKSGTVGGGGAGFATPGAAGGSANLDGGGGQGGDRATDPAIVTVLIGGTRPVRTVGIGAPISGGGGGAVTMIACRGQVSVSGLIDAGGGGGGGGRPGITSGLSFAGTGGGAGGNIVLQGLSISVTGQVFANGGGGGAGWLEGGPLGRVGDDGARSASTPAPGGIPTSGEGAGGTGGIQGIAPAVGRRPTAANALPGGGGGSVGFLQTYTPMGVLPMLNPVALSPSFGMNRSVKTR
jgi:hypothetical protein